MRVCVDVHVWYIHTRKCMHQHTFTYREVRCHLKTWPFAYQVDVIAPVAAFCLRPAVPRPGLSDCY